jgi:aldehyde dehydrogenase (NAD(P)+)
VGVDPQRRVSIVPRVTTDVTPQADVDRTLDELAQAKGSWAALDLPSRLALLNDLKARTWREAERWVQAAVAAKGIPDDSPLAGEEWLSGPYALLIGVDALHTSLDRIWRGRTTYNNDWVRAHPDGRAIVDVLPIDWRDRLLLSGFRAEVWMQPGVGPAELAANTAALYRTPSTDGGVCLVLGAGNIASIPPLDILYKMFAEGMVVVLKMNPVNDYLGPIFEEIFAEFVHRGFLRFVYGGSDVGRYLTAHPVVDEIHVTGSQRTHDLIVFGPGAEGEERKRRRDPVLDKPVTSELGGVSPAVVVPGPWSEADLRFQAEHFVTQRLHNAGFNCIASQVLVLPDTWEHTDRFVDLVEEVFAAAPDRPAYYPGADERRRAAAERHDDVTHHGTDDVRSHLRNVAPDSRSFAFTEEFFTSVFATTRLAGDTAAAYLETAVAFCNDMLHGTLGATIMIHPTTMAELGDRLESALTAMHYGCIGVNAWSGAGFLLPRAAWGGYPGAPLHDIESGRGVVHNALLFDRPEKTVVYGPFRPVHRALGAGEIHMSPKPPWFVTNITAAATARALTEFAAEGKIRTLPRIFVAALRG